MFKFVCKFSGGQIGHLLNNVEAYVRAVAPCATLSPGMYDVISADSKGADQKVLTRMGVLKAGLIHGLITEAQARALVSDRDGKAELIMRKLRAVLAFHMHEPAVQEAIEQCDVYIIGAFLKRSDITTCKTPEAAVHQTLQDVKTKLKLEIDTSEFDKFKPQPQPADNKKSKNHDKETLA